MNEQHAWDLYFLTLVGWGRHPGYNRPNTPRPSLEECAKLADDMLEIRRRKWPHGSEQ